MNKSPIKMEFSAGGIITNNKGQILMIQDQWGKWTFPKGHIDKGENPEQAALREVKEEVGLKAKIIKHLLKDDYWFVASWEKDKPRVHKIVYWFLMQADGIPKPQAQEISAARWFKLDEIKNLVTYENTTKLLAMIRDQISD